MPPFTPVNYHSRPSFDVKILAQLYFTHLDRAETCFDAILLLVVFFWGGFHYLNRKLRFSSAYFKWNIISQFLSHKYQHSMWSVASLIIVTNPKWRHTIQPLIEAIKSKNISKQVPNLYKLVEIDLDTLQMSFGPFWWESRWW